MTAPANGVREAGGRPNISPNTPRRRGSPGPLIVLCLAACGGPAGDGAGMEAGGAGAPPPLRLERVARVDGLAAPYSQIRSLVVDSAGRIYVADTRARQIFVFGADGAPLGTLGRPGEGPGEFRSLGAQLALVDGAILAVDYIAGRLTLFEPGGEVRAISVWSRPEQGPPPVWFLSAAGSALGVSEVRLPLGTIPPGVDPPPAPRPALVYHELRGDGSSRRLDALTDSATPWLSPPWCTSGDGRSQQSFTLPFTGRGPLRAVLPDGRLALGEPESYTITLVDPATGVVSGSIQRDVPPIPFRDEYWEAQGEVEEFLWFEREYGGPLRTPSGARCPYYEMKPERLPVLRTLIADEAGRLWVESTAPDGIGFLVAVFDAEGRLLGEGPMPDRQWWIPPFARGDRLHVVVSDTLGVQSIEVWEAHRAGR